jgi:hypothetical protein
MGESVPAAVKKRAQKLGIRAEVENFYLEFAPLA